MACADVALVLGGASCLWSDLEATRALVTPEECTIVACNDAGFAWPGRLDHWATLHPEELALREEKREEAGFPGGYRTWTRPYPFGVKERERLCDEVLAGWEGSSGLLAVGVALEVGAKRVILCGVPMDATPHFNRGRRPWGGFSTYRKTWEEREGELIPAVRSWSGWTRELLGQPDRAWVCRKDT